jgi:hypothetical protein
LEVEMSRETDREYYLRRAADEMAAAEQAANVRSAALHLDLARTYRERAARPAEHHERHVRARQQERANG